jgi:hypothetical protein
VSGASPEKCSRSASAKPVLPLLEFISVAVASGTCGLPVLRDRAARPMRLNPQQSARFRSKPQKPDKRCIWPDNALTEPQREVRGAPGDWVAICRGEQARSYLPARGSPRAGRSSGFGPVGRIACAIGTLAVGAANARRGRGAACTAGAASAWLTITLVGHRYSP